ncbi:hypothetical protein INR49_002622, partial [Caranx melampygus]
PRSGSEAKCFRVLRRWAGRAADGLHYPSTVRVSPSVYPRTGSRKESVRPLRGLAALLGDPLKLQTPEPMVQIAALPHSEEQVT